MFAKKRLELIIEKPAFKRACRILEDAGVNGYTAFSAFAGYGANMLSLSDVQVLRPEKF